MTTNTAANGTRSASGHRRGCFFGAPARRRRRLREGRLPIRIWVNPHLGQSAFGDPNVCEPDCRLFTSGARNAPA